MTKQEAIARLEAFEEGIPFDAIRVLYDHEPDPEIVEKVQFALEHAFDRDLYYDDHLEMYCDAPCWYAIVAENHLDIAYLDPLIRIFTEPEEEYDFLFDQAGFVLEKMFDHFGEAAVRPAMEAIDRMVEEGSDTPWLYLLTCLPYADISYADQVISWLENPGTYWKEPLIVHLATAPQFSASLPVLRRLQGEYEEEFSGLPKKDFKRHILIELEGTIEALESGKPGGSIPWEPFSRPGVLGMCTMRGSGKILSLQSRRHFR
ncbi:MAG: hypothetical protein IPJ40_10540 [Saprospirales bacterium]|nr:hypothetical protein [Saprospirales bacterium]